MADANGDKYDYRTLKKAHTEEEWARMSGEYEMCCEDEAVNEDEADGEDL